MSDREQEKAAKRAQWEEINRAKAAAKQKEKDAPDEGVAAAAPRKQFQAIRGTRDLLPPETQLWNHVEWTAHEVFGTFGFGEIRVPIFEPTDLFARAVGGETDIVSKEMYTFTDRADEKSADSAGAQISLRPEATASVCRAYIEHSMQQLPQPVKLWYTGPMFRRERPQKGRYRQFYQIGAEVLGGTDAPAIDAEVIEMVMTFFAWLELTGVQLDGRCDAVIVIGSANSSNTISLTTVAESEGCTNVLRVNSADELPDDLDGTVGLTAGASAPEWLVQTVLDRLAPSDGVEFVTTIEEDEYFPPPPELRDLLRAVHLAASATLGIPSNGERPATDDRTMHAAAMLVAEH